MKNKTLAFGRTSRLSRRSMLGGSAVAGIGLAALGLVGCGDDDDNGAGATPTQGAGATPTSGDPTPTATPASSVNRGGKISVVAPEPEDLNPHTGISGSEHQTLWLIHDNLIAYDEKSVPRPELSLAESWEVNSPTELVLKLRSGVSFHDGEALTADVIKYNLEVVMDPATASVSQEQIGVIDHIDTPDETTVVLTLKKPSASLLLALGDRGGMVVSRAALEAKGLQDYAVSPTGGSGPFMFDKWTRNSSMTLKRNPNFWRSRNGESLPYLDELQLKFISEDAVRVAALQSGEASISPVTPEDLPVIERFGNLRLDVFNGASTANLFMNRNSPVLGDARVRRAISYVFDRQALVDAITDGRSETAVGLITPAQWAFNPDVPHPTHDPQIARELFDAAGTPAGTTIKAVTYAGRAAEGRQVELLQRWLADLDINLETDFLQPAAAFALYKEGNHDCFFSGFSIRADPNGSIGEIFRSGAGFAWTLNPQTQELEPDVDALLDKANEVYDLETRKELYTEVQDLIINEYAMASFLYYNNNYLGVADSVGTTASLFGGEGKPRFAELYREG